MADEKIGLEEKLSKLGEVLPLEPPSDAQRLLALLDHSESLLSDVDPSPPPSMLAALDPLRNRLPDVSLSQHPDVDVRIAAASCISQIIRIMMPTAPYEGQQMKRIFRMLVDAFAGLDDVHSRSYPRRISILQITASARTHIMMLDLDCHELILQMLRHFFKTVSETNARDVMPQMEIIIIDILKKMDDYPPELLSCLLDNVKQDNEDISCTLAERVIEKCAAELKPYLLQAIEHIGASFGDYHGIIGSIYQEHLSMAYTSYHNASGLINKMVASSPTIQASFSPAIQAPTPMMQPCFSLPMEASSLPPLLPASSSLSSPSYFMRSAAARKGGTKMKNVVSKSSSTDRFVDSRCSIKEFVKCFSDSNNIVKERFRATPFGWVVDCKLPVRDRELYAELLGVFNPSLGTFFIGGHNCSFTSLHVAMISGMSHEGSEVKIKKEKGDIDSPLRCKFFGKNELTVALARDALNNCRSLGDDRDLDDELRLLILIAFGSFLLPHGNQNIYPMALKYLERLDNLHEYAWASAVHLLLLDSFKEMYEKKSALKSIGYMKGCGPILSIWLLETIRLCDPVNPNGRNLANVWEVPNNITTLLRRKKLMLREVPASLLNECAFQRVPGKGNFVGLNSHDMPACSNDRKSMPVFECVNIGLDSPDTPTFSSHEVQTHVHVKNVDNAQRDCGIIRQDLTCRPSCRPHVENVQHDCRSLSGDDIIEQESPDRLTCRPHVENAKNIQCDSLVENVETAFLKKQVDILSKEVGVFSCVVAFLSKKLAKMEATCCHVDLHVGEVLNDVCAEKDVNTNSNWEEVIGLSKPYEEEKVVDFEDPNNLIISDRLKDVSKEHGTLKNTLVEGTDAMKASHVTDDDRLYDVNIPSSLICCVKGERHKHACMENLNKAIKKRKVKKHLHEPAWMELFEIKSRALNDRSRKWLHDRNREHQMIRLITSPFSKNDAGQTLSPDAAFAQATEPKHPGRLRTSGCGATITSWYKKFAPPSLKVTQLKNTIQSLSNQVEIMKERGKERDQWEKRMERLLQEQQANVAAILAVLGQRQGAFLPPPLCTQDDDNHVIILDGN